jgi:hypothetical protein
VIDCGGRALSEITPVLMVDPRVLVMRTADGRAWVILEKPLAPDRALAVERALARLGHDPGPVDGVIDAASRRALARFAASRGAAYAFQASPLTEALAAELVP